jgi:hypothetical protein
MHTGWRDETMGLNSCSVVACCSSSLHPTEGAFTAYPPYNRLVAACRYRMADQQMRDDLVCTGLPGCGRRWTSADVVQGPLG